MTGAADSQDAIIHVGGDGCGYVPVAEHEKVRRKKACMVACLMKIAQAMNRMADELEKEDSSLTDETRPAPLGD